MHARPVPYRAYDTNNSGFFVRVISKKRLRYRYPGLEKYGFQFLRTRANGRAIPIRGSYRRWMDLADGIKRTRRAEGERK